MRDLVHNLGVELALASAVQSANIKGPAIDTAEFGSLMFVITTGAIAGSGNYTVTVQESDTTTDGDFTDAVGNAALGSSLVSPVAADSIYKVGYVGSKRYARLAVTKNSGTSVVVGAVAIKGNPRHQPVA